MRIVILAKPVPDSTGQERLGADGRLDRGVAPAVINGNDEYVLEAALKLVEAHGGEITLLAMAQPNAPETLRKGLAMGAHRATLVTDGALAGSCSLGTARVLAAALRTLSYDLVMAGADSSDGGGGVVPAAIATYLGLLVLCGGVHLPMLLLPEWKAGQSALHATRCLSPFTALVAITQDAFGNMGSHASAAALARYF